MKAPSDLSYKFKLQAVLRRVFFYAFEYIIIDSRLICSDGIKKMSG
jgi:hypothetical protein